MLKPIINKIQNLSKSKNRKYDLFSLMTLCIFVIMVILGAMGVPINDFVYIGFNGILVCVTVKYTIITKDILEDGKKKREIEFIQRQLEYFYYPVLHTIEKSQIQANIVYNDLMYEEYETGKNHGYDFCIFQFIIDALKTNIEEIYKHKYLSSEAIRKKFQDIEIYLVHTPFKYEGHEYTYYEYLNGDEGPIFNEMLDKILSLKEDLKSEIEDLNKKLIDLIN